MEHQIVFIGADLEGRGGGFREFEPLKLKKERCYKMLTWPQNVRNTISEELNFKNCLGCRLPPTGEDAPYHYRRGCPDPLQEEDAPYHLQETTSLL